MGILELIVTIAIGGLIVWAITTIVPMPEAFRRAIVVLAVVFLVLYVLQSIGALSSLNLRLK